MNVFESFRAVRWIRTLNLMLQAILVVSLFGGLNYIAKNHAWRFDLTKQRKFSLSPETQSYIKSLNRPVQIILTVSPESDNPEVRGLVDEYVYATADRDVGRITREVVDVYQNRRRTEELGIEVADSIVLISGDKRRVLRVNEMYTMKDKVRHAFRGEQVLTAAILDVANPKRHKIYFLAGHAEARIDNTDAHVGLSRFREELLIRGFDVDGLDLTAARKVPDDASLLIIVAPRSRYSRAEQEMLRQYLGAKAGRLILFLTPGISTANLGLDDLLLDWGVLVHDDAIMDPQPEFTAENGDLLIRAFAPHPITNTLIGIGSQYLQVVAARTVVPDPGRTTGSGLNTITLAATSTQAWGERDFRQGAPPKFTPGVDTRPLPGMEPADRLGVIVASERLGVRENLPFSVPGGKVVVFGAGDVVTNGRIDSFGSQLLGLNAVNWTVDRDAQLNIPPRPLERFYLSLSAADFMKLRYALLLVLPGGALALGLLVYWTRRV